MSNLYSNSAGCSGTVAAFACRTATYTRCQLAARGAKRIAAGLGMKHRQTALRNGQLVTLRPAEKSDARKIIHFRRIVHANSPYLNACGAEANWSWFEMRRSIAIHRASPTNSHVLAFLADNLVAEVQLRAFGLKRLRHDSELAIAIHPDHIGQGLGQTMISQIIKTARALGQLRRISLKVHAGNTAAIALYERCGFTQEGRRIEAVRAFGPDGIENEPEQYDDEILMGLYLGAEKDH